MLKNLDYISQDRPTIFNEDVYLFTDSGKVLTGRHRRDPIKNIFDLMEASELSFIRDNMFFAGLKPLLLVDSSIGPIFIDNSLFGSYRLLIAIVPHFSKSEFLSVIQQRLKSITFPSLQMKAELEFDYQIALDETHEEFAQRLLVTHRGAYYYRSRSRTNGELSMLMSEIAYDYSRFCGCELQLNISGVGLFEMKNELCIDSYIFALTSLLFLARHYSINTMARMDVFFNEMGVYFEFGFELASEYKSISLLNEANELKNFKFRVSSRLLECDFYQDDRAFATRVYPWFRHPNSSDIKEPRKEFIYNL